MAVHTFDLFADYFQFYLKDETPPASMAPLGVATRLTVCSP
jgi:hypothetical protein